jgi:hypothetical protein
MQKNATSWAFVISLQAIMLDFYEINEQVMGVLPRAQWCNSVPKMYRICKKMQKRA